MENNVELAKQSLTILCKAENRLVKEVGLQFAKAITKMSLAKNIRLAVGTIEVWEECLIEDIKSGVLDYDDFIIATKKVIREPLFNRIDYADIYTIATELTKHRRMKWQKDFSYDGVPMPQEIKEMCKNIGKDINSLTNE